MGEVTTGHGAMVLVPTLLAVASEVMTWETAAPLLAAGIIGLIWPERRSSAPEPGKEAPQDSAAQDKLRHPPAVETVVAAYRLGVNHATSQDPGPTPSKLASVPPIVCSLAVLIAVGLMVGACVQPARIMRQVDVATMASASLPRANDIAPAAGLRR
jgi:hypothetical protein